MKKSILTNKTTVFVSASIIAILLLSLFFVWSGYHNSSQATPAFVIDIAFQGEYKIGNGEWHTIIKGNHIPSTQGDVTLRGTFQMYDPETNEPFGTFFADLPVHLYFNHIGGYAILPDGEIIPFDSEHEMFGEDNCAVMWGAISSTGEAPITIVLQNPHNFGNEFAVDDFLANMSAAEGIYLESIMLDKGEPQRNIGFLVLILSLIVLGTAIFSTIIHVKIFREMWLLGLMSLSASGYLLFDAFSVSIWNSSYITNTRILGLCMMFYMFFSNILIVKILKERMRAIAFTATIASAFSILTCVFLSLSKTVRFFDTWFGWAIAESCVVVILMACLILSFRRATAEERKIYITGLIVLASFVVDFLATAFGWWEGSLVTKFVFLAVFIMILFIVLRIVPSHINAAARAKELEIEQKLLKQALQENRISVMLSQMKPHFIFNTLNTIYHLCDIDSVKAKSTIASFSIYLRNNINNLEQCEMIHFEKELSFINAYLDIEKVRFDDELQIVYDIGVSNFKLPALTVQPIVENAVKHGTSKKEGVSYLYISTRETEAFYEIEIRDTGVGFDVNNRHYDGCKHIGVSNVRQRLELLCDGTLTIESTPGVGTTAIVKIPKTEESSK